MILRVKALCPCIFATLLMVPLVGASEYSTFIGDANSWRIARIAADTAGDVYIGGTRVIEQSSDAIVMKLDPAGNVLLFRIVSGTGSNTVNDIALDSAGNIYVAGATSSPDFPVHNAMQSAAGPGFLVKLTPDASQTVWSTYFREAITAVAVDSGSNVYLTGSTNDPQFPVTAGLPNGPVVPVMTLGAISGAFITKIAAAGDRIIYSGVISGSNKPCGCCSSCFLSARSTTGISVAVDAAGFAYLAGNTDTSNIPTTAGAFLSSGTGAFAAKVKPDGSALAYLTYIGSTNYPSSPATNPANTAASIACDSSGDAFLAGSTSDPDFPASKGAAQVTFGGPANANSFIPPTDAFALELNSSGSALLWATYLGGTGADAANSIALDSTDDAWIVGTTASPNFPNGQGWSQGSDFVTEIDPAGSKFVYSARYPNEAASRGVAPDASGTVHVAGPEGLVSAIDPATAPLPRIFGIANAASGPIDGRIAGGELISIYGPHIGPATPIITVADASGNLPASAGGYQVTLKNFAGPLPLLYVSDSQINAVVPFGVYETDALTVETPAGTTPAFPATVLPAIPGIFQNPDGSAIAVNQNGTLNSAANPAQPGSYVSIWVTGAASSVAGSAGQIMTAANDYRCCSITSGGSMFPVSYAGAAPGAAAGVTQINLQITAGPIFGGVVPVYVIASNGSLSSAAAIYVR